ncbi:Ig-like domain-containing protein [Luteitalea sp.]|uniref:Ig-like domain-containing protein n=1 Tax=Luteitalea sp. TaxID=2004800 RepID=UPI0025C04018|nr:Ig-like domain-containing protein [Luteitalea sp.]
MTQRFSSTTRRATARLLACLFLWHSSALAAPRVVVAPRAAAAPLAAAMSNTADTAAVEVEAGGGTTVEEQTTTGAVRPILECVANLGGGQYRAYFGYLNENTVATTIAIGTNNRFTPTPQGRGQPTVFAPGRTPFYPNAAFSVAFNGSNLVWTLRGPDNQTRTATASSTSTACAAQPAPTVTIATPAAGAVVRGTGLVVTGTIAGGTPPNTVTVNGVNATVTGTSYTATLSSLAAGALTLTATVRDAQNRTGTATRNVTVDNTAPTLTLTSPANNSVTGTASATVAGTVTDASAVTVTVNGTNVPVTSGAFSTSVPLVVGTNTITVVATDAAGNQSTQTRTVTYTTGPTLAVRPILECVVELSPTSFVAYFGYLNDNSVAVTIPVGANNRFTPTPEGRGQPTVFQPGRTPFYPNAAFSVPFNGSNLVWTLRGPDNSTRTSTASSGSTRCTNPAPTVTLSAPAEGAVVRSPISVTGAISGGTAPVTVNVNGVAATVTGTSFTAAVTAADGALTLTATATDAGARTGTATRAVTVDSTAPTVAITSPTNGQAVTGATVTVTGTVSDTSAVTVTVNGQPATVTGAGYGATVPLGAGATETITVVATDAAGNTSTQSVTVNRDATPPVVAITSPANGAVVRGPLVAVAGTASDAGGSVTVIVNGEPVVVSGGAFSTTVPSPQGPLTITVVASDSAGNSATATATVTVDAVPPVLTITAPTNGALVNTPTVTISGTVVDTSATTVVIGGASVPVVGGAFTYSAPTGTDGTQVYIVTATDAAGNETTQSVNVVVDRTAPVLSVSSPVEGATVSTVPLVVTGLVTDQTATTVTVNGQPATLVADAWSISLTSLADGPQTLTAVATDAAGNVVTVTRDITLDASAPVVVITAPAAGALTRLGTITVTGTVAERALTGVTVNGVVASVTPAGGDVSTFTAAVPLAEGDVTLVVTATDASGRTGTAQVTVTRDSSAPLVDVTVPARVTLRSPGTATVTASDTLALAQLVVSLNGTVVSTSPTSPVAVPLVVPSGAAVGDVITLVAVATDTAGNATTATRTVRIAGDGAAVGQVVSDTTGLPVPGALVQLGTVQATTDARGQYSFPTADANALVTVTLAGTLPVTRTVAVVPEVGTVLVDARLTPLADAVTVAPAGGTVAAGPITLTVAPGAGASVRLTRLSPQGLPGLLPLGWSPLATFDVQATPALGAGATATVTLLPASLTTATLAQYDAANHTWTALAVDLPVTGGTLTVPVDTAGTYAVIVQDVQTPPLPGAVVGTVLPAAPVVAIPLTATSAGVVSPAILPPGGGTAVGLLAVQSQMALPSGTLVQANVTETFTLTTGAVASDEPRRQDVILYRTPVPDATVLPSGFVTDVSATFPIAPSRTYAVADLVQGVVHLDILAGREAARGTVGGGLATTVTSGSARVVLPGGSVPTDTVITLTPTVLSTFVPTAAGIDALTEMTLDLAGQTLSAAAELSTSATGLTIAPTDTLLVARVERTDGVPFVTVIARASLVGDRIVTTTTPGLPGVTRGGRYVFYRVSGPVGWIAATVSNAGSPTPGVTITNTGLPFVGLTSSAGQSLLPAAPGTRTIAAQLPRSVLAAQAGVTVTADTTTPIAIALVGTVQTATVTPADGATSVPVSAQVQITSPAVLAAAAATTTVVLTNTVTAAVVPTRLQLSTSGQILAVIPTTRLAPATTYRLEAVGLPTTTNDTVLVPSTTFTTAADAALVVDATRLVFAMPDATGVSAITALAGTFPPGTQVLIVNTGNGVVLSLTAGNDGSLTGSIQASVFDRLLITITDPLGRTTSVQRSHFVAADGTTAVGSGGGVVTGPGGVALIVPEGAVDTAATFKIEAIDYAATFPSDPRPAGPPSTLGPAMHIRTDTDRFAKEIDLAFPRPADAPPGAYFYVYRRLQGPNGLVAFESLDDAFEDGTGPGAKIVTASDPWAGYIKSIGGYDLNGVVQGVAQGLLDGYAFVMWSFDQLLPGRPTRGAVTGFVRRDSPTGVPVPVPDAIVSGVDVQGNPLHAGISGVTVAVTQGDGKYTLHDDVFSGGVVDLIATANGEVRTARPYEVGPDYSRATGVRHYTRLSTANFLFPPVTPPPPAPVLDVTVYRGDRVDTRGIVTVGESLTVVFKVPSPPTNPVDIRAATINGQSYTLTAETGYVLAGARAFATPYTALQAGTVTIVATADPLIGPPVTQNYVARAIAPGGGVATVEGEAPAVIAARTRPRLGGTGVPVTTAMEVSFTEPVTHVVPQHAGDPARVTLEDAQGTAVPIALLGIGATGPVPQVQYGSVVTGLTIQPLAGLRYNTSYTLRLTNGIVDGDATPRALVPYETSFTTFGPETITATGPPRGTGGLVALGAHLYVAENVAGNTGGATQLRGYDISNPVAPQPLPLLEDPASVAPGLFTGVPVDLSGEVTDEARTLALSVIRPFAPSGPSNVHLVDVTAHTPRWVGAVSVGTQPIDGLVRRAILHGERIFALTTGLGKGLQVISVPQMRALFGAATAEGRTAPYYQMLSRLHRLGEGFGQEAIVATVFLDTDTGDNSQQSDLAMLPIVLNDVVVPLAITTGRRTLALVDPNTSTVLFSGPVPSPTGLAYGEQVAAAMLGGRPVAIVAGLSPTGGRRLVLVDVATPTTPVHLATMDLPTGALDTRSRLTLRDGLLYVGGSAGTTIVNVANPLTPVLVGRVAGTGDYTVVTDTGFLLSASDAFAQTPRALQTTALGATAVVARPRTTFMREVPATPPTAPATTEATIRAVDLAVAVYPSTLEVTEAQVEIYNGGTLVQALPATIAGGTGTVQLPTGFVRPRGQQTLAVLAAQTVDGTTLRSAPTPLPLGQIRVRLDSNNDTKMGGHGSTDALADEAAARDPQQSFAFWEADPTLVGEDALTDYARLVIRREVELDNSVRVGVRLLGARWDLKPQALPTPGGIGPVDCSPDQAYLCDPAVATRQIAVNQLEDATRIPQAQGNGLFLVPPAPLERSDNPFVFRCVPTEGSSSGCPNLFVGGALEASLQVGEISETGAFTPLHSVRLDIRPLRLWMTVKSVRRSEDPDGAGPLTVFTPREAPVLESGYVDVPTQAKAITVLVHGFNNSENYANTFMFARFLKRLYWASHPVLLPQPSSPHVVGFSWPGNQFPTFLTDPDSVLVDNLTRVYFPEDEFHALQAGKVLSEEIMNLKAPSGRSVDVIAHSLGNMVVNSAFTFLEPGVVSTYVMHQAALPAEAFSQNYGLDNLSLLVVSAANQGYPDDQPWEAMWSNMDQGLRDAWASRFPSGTPPTDVQRAFTHRWRLQRPDDWTPATLSAGPILRGGPWRGVFSGTARKTKLVNTWSDHDMVTGFIWLSMQYGQKPNVGVLGLGAENAVNQFWGALPNDTEAEQFLWPVAQRGGSTRRLVRQWAELAHWFPSLSVAAGRTGNLEILPTFGYRALDFSQYGKVEGAESLSAQGIRDSHSYLINWGIQRVWGGWREMAVALGRNQQ